MDTFQLLQLFLIIKQQHSVITERMFANTLHTSLTIIIQPKTVMVTGNSGHGFCFSYSVFISKTPTANLISCSCLLQTINSSATLLYAACVLNLVLESVITALNFGSNDSYILPNSTARFCVA